MCATWNDGLSSIWMSVKVIVGDPQAFSCEILGVHGVFDCERERLGLVAMRGGRQTC